MRNGCAAGVQDGGGTAGSVLLLLQYFSHLAGTFRVITLQYKHTTVCTNGA